MFATARTGFYALCLSKPFDDRRKGRDAQSMAGSPARPPLGALAWLIARDSHLTFGGGTATAEVLRRSLGKRGWLADDDHRSLYALSRLTPGTNLLAYCTAVGWRLRQTEGAIVAWLASSIPASMIAIVATVCYERASASPGLRVVVLIGTGIALLLLLSSAWHLARPQLVDSPLLRSAVIVAVVLALVIAGLPPLVVLLASAALGAAWGVSRP